MTVTVTGSGALIPNALVISSHTSHDERAGVAGVISCGAPGIPTSGPRGCASISLRRTRSGFDGSPTINRADDKFNAGYSLSPTRTYKAPEFGSAKIRDVPADPAGRTNDQNSAPRHNTAVNVTPATNAIDWRRPGSVSMR